MNPDLLALNRDFDSIFRAVLPIVLPPINPRSDPNSAIPAEADAAYPAPTHNTGAGDFINPVSPDEE